MIRLLRFGILLIAIPAMTSPLAAGCSCWRSYLDGPVTDYERPMAPYEPRSIAPYQPWPIAYYERPPIVPYEPRSIAPRHYVGHRPSSMHHVAKHPIPQQRDEKAPPASPPPALPLRAGRG